MEAGDDVTGRLPYAGLPILRYVGVPFHNKHDVISDFIFTMLSTAISLTSIKRFSGTMTAMQICRGTSPHARQEKAGHEHLAICTERTSLRELISSLNNFDVVCLILQFYLMHVTETFAYLDTHILRMHLLIFRGLLLRTSSHYHSLHMFVVQEDL